MKILRILALLAVAWLAGCSSILSKDYTVKVPLCTEDGLKSHLKVDDRIDTKRFFGRKLKAVRAVPPGWKLKFEKVDTWENAIYGVVGPLDAAPEDHRECFKFKLTRYEGKKALLIFMRSLNDGQKCDASRIDFDFETKVLAPGLGCPGQHTGGWVAY